MNDGPQVGPPGLLLGGTASGCGKTIATLAVLRALQRAGSDPRAAKAGPDFIDPSHHGVVVDPPSRTLDTWLQGTEGVRRNYARTDGDICVVEGMMGLYDGDRSSTAAVAETLSLPVVLVVDASAGMQSVGATALGFREYAEEAEFDIDVVGVIAQRCHGGRHERGVRAALPDGMTYLGRVPPTPELEVPERHLGLHMGAESPIPDDALDAAAEEIRTQQLLEVAREPGEPAAAVRPTRYAPASSPTVAVANDAAFSFVYPATMELFRETGTVRTFSPLAGDPLPDCDGVYLPGGYPERFAAELSDSGALATLAVAAADGLPVFGECGGMLALAESLTTAENATSSGRTEAGTTYEMAGVLPGTVQMHDRYQALDHVELRATGDHPGAATGETVRGHEFHYSSVTVENDAQFAYELVNGEGIDGDYDGLCVGEVVGTYAHFHPESGAFDAFLSRL